VADFEHTNIPADASGPTQTVTILGPTGTVSQGKRLLGDAGAGAPGNGGWFRQNGLWKTFMLYNLDRVGALNAGVDVRIDGAMELASAPDDPDADTFFVELATLAVGSPSFSTEYPWRYVRARVGAFAGAKNVQVGLQIQGQG
jgi:hypothetical protein